MAIMTRGTPFLRKSLDVGIPEACTIKLGGVPKEVIGRSITQSENPKRVFLDICESIT